MGTSNLNHIGHIVKCDEATYHEWKEEITALLSGLSLGHYLTLELDYSQDETTIKEGNQCHHLLYSTLAKSTQQAAPASCKTCS
jgi:hypothetical protein